MLTKNKFFNDGGKFLQEKLLTAITVSLLALGALVFSACESGLGAGNRFDLLEKSNQAVRATYDIYSVDDLLAVNDDLAGDYILHTNLALTDWTPLGIFVFIDPPAPTTVSPFTGTFNGNGFEITIESFSSDGLSAAIGDNAYLGIFGQISGGAVYDLAVNLAVGTVKPDSSPNAASFGGITGYAENASFNRIIVSGTLKLEWDVDYTEYGTGFLYVGGISGNNSSVNITNSSNTADIDVITTDQGASSYTGGLIGRGDGVTIEDSSASGDITAEGPGYNTSAGGVAGYVTQTKIFRTNTTGSITLTGTITDFTGYNFWQVYAGGLVGYSGFSGIINKCSSTDGTVTAFAPYPYAGGLVGYNYGVSNYPDPTDRGSEISQSFADKTVSAISQSSVENDFGGLPYAGGLVGYSSIIASIVKNCYARGDVTATTGGQYAWAGGLAGANANNSIIERSYATGTVSVTTGSLSLPSGYSQPGANPGAAGGGIAGVNYYTANTLVRYCVALNKLIEGSADPAVYLLHRVVGDLGTVDTSVSPAAAPGILDNNIANAGMVVEPDWVPAFGLDDLDGEDTVSKPDIIDYENLFWDFSTIWAMGTDGYPVLQ